MICFIILKLEMDNIKIYCQDGECIDYSKNRFMTFTQSFDDDELMIPHTKEMVIMFLTFLDTCKFPTIKPDDDKEIIKNLLDMAQFCNLQESEIPGKHYIIDLVYENMEKEFSLKFDYLCDFAQETGLLLYDYNFCKNVVTHWKEFLTYGMFMNNPTIKQQQIDKIAFLM